MLSSVNHFRVFRERDGALHSEGEAAAAAEVVEAGQSIVGSRVGHFSRVRPWFVTQMNPFCLKLAPAHRLPPADWSLNAREIHSQPEPSLTMLPEVRRFCRPASFNHVRTSVSAGADL